MEQHHRRTASRMYCMIAASTALLLSVGTTLVHAQNSMVGDGFGGRLWYRPTNYSVGSYSAYSLCYTDPCDSTNTQLYTWGDDTYGQLGDGVLYNGSSVPVMVPTMDNVRLFTAGYLGGAIKHDGTGWVWGDPWWLGLTSTPVQVITDAYHVDAGAKHLCFVKTDGTVWCLGENLNGQLGDSTNTPTYDALVEMTGMNNAVRVACGYYNTFVLKADGTVWVTGFNEFGLLGDPTYTFPETIVPRPVPGLTDVVDIKANAQGCAALDAQGRVFSWGGGGANGDGDYENDTVPEQVIGLENIVAISGCADGLHFMALDANGNCFEWGRPLYEPSMLFPVFRSSNVVDIMAGEIFSYFVRSDGTLWAEGGSFTDTTSIWLGMPEHLYSESPQPPTQLDLTLLPNTCAVVATVAVPSIACDGSGGTITVTHSGGALPYSYDIGNGPQPSNVFTGLVAGDYTVTVTDAVGCITSASCTLELGDPAPTVIYETHNICFDEGLGYVLPSGAIAYPPPYVDGQGLFLDTVSSGNGCDTLYWITLTYIFPMIYRPDTICIGGSYTLPSGRIVDAPGFYYDTLVVANACDTAFQIDLLGVLELAPNAEVYSTDTLLFEGNSVQLIAAGGTDYAWSPSTGLSCANCPEPVATPDGAIEYCIVVTNGNSCPGDTACIKLYVEPLCTADNVFIPSAFSPNINGTNDLQCVYGGECIASMTFGIYDRWGTKVFEATDTKACWDGKYNGQDLDPAVFVYHLSGTLINGETLEKQGNITLVR